jgi:hypothetical protein
MPAPVEISINPASVRIPAGYGVFHGKVRLTNVGHAGITVTPETLRLDGNRACTQTAPSWLSLQGRSAFTLAAGHSASFGYTVSAGRGVSGTAAIVFNASASHSADQYAAAVGMRVTVGTGVQTCTPVPRHLAATPRSYSSPGLLGSILIGIAGVVLVLIIVLGTIRKIRRRHEHRRA